MGKWQAAFLVSLALGGCGSLPTTGPSASQIESASKSDVPTEAIQLVELTLPTIQVLERHKALPLTGRFVDRRPGPTMTVGVGDSLGVTIFEAGSGGLFSTSAGSLGGGTKSASLPPQVVGADGNISVPYAGRVMAAGKSTEQIERTIVEKLRDKAIEPQVLVTMHAAKSNLVTVDGEVGTAGRVPLSPKGDRLIDVIASAGGSKGRAGDLFVRLTRDGKTASVPYRTLLEDPAQNIWARAGDQIFVYREPQTFTAYGATGRSGTFPFDYDQFTLAEAIGRAAGLEDNRAEPAGVFIYRRERAEVVCDLTNERPCVGLGSPRTVIYRLNMRDPAGVALAQRFLVRNKDLVYVANADMAEFAKVVRVFAGIASAANTASSLEARLAP